MCITMYIMETVYIVIIQLKLLYKELLWECKM